MNDSKRIWAWVGVAVVVVAAVVWIVWRPGASQPAPSGPTPVFAPQGQLTPQFPPSLVVASGAAIGSSYAINYSSSTNQYTAEYDSSSSLSVLYGDYMKYFASNGWMVTNSSSVTSASKIGAMYAATSSANVNVTIISQGSGSEATVSYVAQ